MISCAFCLFLAGPTGLPANALRHRAGAAWEQACVGRGIECSGLTDASPRGVVEKVDCVNPDMAAPLADFDGDRLPRVNVTRVDVIHRHGERPATATLICHDCGAFIITIAIADVAAIADPAE